MLPLAGIQDILSPLIYVFEHVLLFFHDTVGVGWGMSIVLLTVVIRAALVPLTLKQFRSMQAMQKLAPHMNALKEKYKGDKQRLNQEMMKLYQEHKINPLASCLPLAAQMPVFISLFYMLRKDLRVQICGQTAKPCELVHAASAKFLFVPDLTNKATGTVLIVLMVLYVGSQLASSLLMTVSADKNQRYLMMFLPLIFIMFVIRFPAGLIVYWITTNLWTIVQQYIVRKRVGPMRPATALAGGPEVDPGGDDLGDGPRKPSPSPSQGGLLARLTGAATPAPAGANGDGKARGGPPPPPPRQRKKKRSGRRR